MVTWSMDKELPWLEVCETTTWTWPGRINIVTITFNAYLTNLFTLLVLLWDFRVYTNLFFFCLFRWYNCFLFSIWMYCYEHEPCHNLGMKNETIRWLYISVIGKPIYRNSLKCFQYLLSLIFSFKINLKLMMDNFMYYFKRFLPAIFIILFLLFFPVRRFLRENGFFVFGNKTLKEALLWAKQDSIRVADSLKKNWDWT